MQKTGESYTTARLYVVRKKEAVENYAAKAGMSDASVKKATGRAWAEWVKLLDAAKAAEKPHREIARYLSSMGTPGWWSQMVTVGYERIRGLRERGQRRGGQYEVNKSRTFAVDVSKLFDAFAKPRTRAKWLPNVKVRTSRANKTMRLDMADGTRVVVGFLSKGAKKSAVAVQHSKLADTATAAKTKQWWGERFDALTALFT
ncbi:MAG: hypothetical protein LC659_16255, partial [Myxococcales bacterium]|nr:hypothetical protein [Myxococcales bacterium]